MSKYLDQDGVLYFWQKLKALLGGKVDKVSGKGLSTNDYTTTEKNKLAGIANGANNYTLPTASSSTKGGVKVGDGLSIDSEGVLSAGAYALPTASSTTKGGVKIGSGLTMTDETLSVNAMGAASSGAAGTAGIVPVPAAGKQNSYLRGDATWAVPSDEKVKIIKLGSSDSDVYPILAAGNDAPTSGQTYDARISRDGTGETQATLDAHGNIVAKSFTGEGSGLTDLDADEITSGTIAAARLPAASASAQGAMSAAHYSKLEALPTNSTLQSTYATKDTATQSANGLMSSSDKTKLDAFGAASTYALKSEAYSLPTASSTTKGGVKIGSGLTMTDEVLSADPQTDNNFTDTLKSKLDGIESGANAYVHPSYTARTGKPTGNQTPGFGSTFTISQITSDATGHVTAATDRTVKIPNSTASSSANGLMSSSDYTKLSGLPDGATLWTAFDSKAGLNTATSSANGLMSSSDKSKLDAFGAASTYALKTDISSMYKHKGSVSTTNDLPSTGNTEGDVYNVTASGMNYVWVVTSGTGAWDALGEVFTIDSITNSEIDTILAS